MHFKLTLAIEILKVSPFDLSFLYLFYFFSLFLQALSTGLSILPD